MGRCEVCGNAGSGVFQIVREGRAHDFDSFECAIHALAPACDNCGCRILGHPIEIGGSFFCCGPCASESGAVPSGGSWGEKSYSI